MPKITEDKIAVDFEEICTRCNGEGHHGDDDQIEYFGRASFISKNCSNCGGVGAVLTPAGNELIKFLLRHLPYRK